MKKFYRIKEGRKIAGVCAGLGEYLDVDPVLVRVFFVATLFFSGFGLLAYLVLWLIAPVKAGGGYG